MYSHVVIWQEKILPFKRVPESVCKCLRPQPNITTSDDANLPGIYKAYHVGHLMFFQVFLKVAAYIKLNNIQQIFPIHLQ